MFKSMSLGAKLALGFGVIAMIMVVIGVAAFMDVTTLAATTADLASDAGMADMAMEMKYAVASQMLMVMEAQSAAEAGDAA
ncbi:MAG: hypothetical protein FDZ70_11330, partial [Actinobacteria bacterium]